MCVDCGTGCATALELEGHDFAAFGKGGFVMLIHAAEAAAYLGTRQRRQWARAMALQPACLPFSHYLTGSQFRQAAWVCSLSSPRQGRGRAGDRRGPRIAAMSTQYRPKVARHLADTIKRGCFAVALCILD